jgi:tetraacyldisaccharide 4'-kinase
MTLRQSLLWPLSLPYGAVAHLRARAYRKGILKQQHLDGTVISVGNLTTGGTGKTPMVLAIAEHLLAEGKNASSPAAIAAKKSRRRPKRVPQRPSRPPRTPSPQPAMKSACSNSAWAIASNSASAQIATNRAGN